jgi:hypothetical protein
LFSPLSSDRSLWAADAVSASGLKNKLEEPYTNKGRFRNFAKL